MPGQSRPGSWSRPSRSWAIWRRSDCRSSFSWSARCEGTKPGWVRVNSNYLISDAVFSYLVQADRLVAHDGWRLLPGYHFDPARAL